MRYLKNFKDLNEDHYVPENIVREYESKIFRESGPGMIKISASSLKEYLEKYFSVTFQHGEDLRLLEPEPNRFSLEMQLSSKAEMINSLTWRKLSEEFSEFEYVEDTSEDTNKNFFVLDLREGIEYDIELKENIEEEVSAVGPDKEEMARPPIECTDDTISSFVYWVDERDGILGEDQIPTKYTEYMKYIANLNKKKISFHQLTPSDISAIVRELDKRGMLAEDVQNEKFVPAGFAYAAKYKIAWNDAIDKCILIVQQQKDLPTTIKELNDLRTKYADEAFPNRKNESSMNEGFKANSGLAKAVRMYKKNPGDLQEIITKLIDAGVKSDDVFHFASLFPRDSFRIEDIRNGKLEHQIKRLFFSGESQEKELKKTIALKEFILGMDSQYGEKNWSSKF